MARPPRLVGAVWDPQPGEDPESVALFGEYLAEEPGTTIQAFIRKHGHSRSRVERLAATWLWRGRKAALDHHLLREQNQAAQDEARARGEAHAKALSEFREWVYESVLAHRATGTTLDPKDVANAYKALIELDRLIHGQSTANVTVRSYDGINPDLLEQSAILDEKILKGA